MLRLAHLGTRCLVGALALSAACGGDTVAVRSGGEVLARVGGLPVTREAVATVARRDGVDEATAQTRVANSLRLVAMRRDAARAAASGDRDADAEWQLAPEREAQLKDAALSRVYLHEVFEPAHESKDMDREFLDRVTTDPNFIDRASHPKLHTICQIIVRKPDPSDDQPPEPGEKKMLAHAPEDDAWRAGARQFAEPAIRMLEEYSPELLGEHDCKLFSTLTTVLTRVSEDQQYMLRVEESIFHVDRPDLWVQPWIDAILAHEGSAEAPGVGFVEPFFTVYGLHLVFVVEVQEETPLQALERGSDAWNEALRETLRTDLLDTWRTRVAFPRHLSRLADKHVVRLASELQ